MTDWNDLSWQARTERIRLQAHAFLQANPANGPVSTSAVATAVVAALGLSVRELQSVQRVLQSRVAPGSPHARQNGELFRAYGRTMRRWQWYTTTAAAESALDVPAAERANSLDPADVAEFLAWKAARDNPPVNEALAKAQALAAQLDLSDIIGEPQ